MDGEFAPGQLAPKQAATSGGTFIDIESNRHQASLEVPVGLVSKIRRPQSVQSNTQFRLQIQAVGSNLLDAIDEVHVVHGRGNGKPH
ncbi:MAG: hypothetical protein H0U67_06135 [Gemmatimonadetes bacterium]|nr:hypothetical protein [Gemmatimonadota bacterium]